MFSVEQLFNLPFPISEISFSHQEEWRQTKDTVVQMTSLNRISIRCPTFSWAAPTFDRLKAMFALFGLSVVSVDFTYFNSSYLLEVQEEKTCMLPFQYDATKKILTAIQEWQNEYYVRRETLLKEACDLSTDPERLQHIWHVATNIIMDDPIRFALAKNPNVPYEVLYRMVAWEDLHEALSENPVWTLLALVEPTLPRISNHRLKMLATCEKANPILKEVEKLQCLR